MEFQNTQLQDAVDELLTTYGDKEEAYAHAKVLWPYVEAIMKRRKVYDLFEVKHITDIIKAGSLLYRLFTKEGHISSYFLLREKGPEIFNAHMIDNDIQIMVYQMCESCMGEDSLADFMIPQKGYPDDIFADAIFIMNLKGDVCGRENVIEPLQN